ncbi:MAG: hypothetical protein QF654_13330 [Alphaproteobacteria bacterium]|jgi:hypothetical protein|nr:hypothetical protein [Alphaproteobacteria bacterium]
MGLTIAEQCEEMRAAVADERVAMCYTPYDRSYEILSAEPGVAARDAAIDAGTFLSYRGWTIEYCPWSGDHLPIELGIEWEMVVERDFGAEPGTAIDMLQKLPPEMVSEEWWLKARHEDWWKERDEIYGLPDFSTAPFEAEAEVPADEPYKPYIDPNLPGMTRTKERPPHLCWASIDFFTGPRCMYAYLPHLREYGIRILSLDQPVDHQPVVIQAVTHCPWCGTVLPASLRKRWTDELDAMGLAPESDDIPERLMSDAWWREAEL